MKCACLKKQEPGSARYEQMRYGNELSRCDSLNVRRECRGLNIEGEGESGWKSPVIWGKRMMMERWKEF